MTPDYKPFMSQMTSDILSPEAKLHLAKAWLAENQVRKRIVATNPGTRIQQEAWR